MTPTQHTQAFNSTLSSWNKPNPLNTTVQFSTRETVPDIALEVDDKCLSCTGQKNVVMQVFKLACLN